MNGMGRVKIYSDVPTPADVYLRFVHEEFYVNPPHAYAQYRAHGSQQMDITTVVQQYVSSYVIKTSS
ncbi:hypothetical protein PGB90_003775 [Kerria lacca]